MITPGKRHFLNDSEGGLDRVVLLNRIQQISHSSRKVAKESPVASPYTSTNAGENARQRKADTTLPGRTYDDF